MAHGISCTTVDVISSLSIIQAFGISVPGQVPIMDVPWMFPEQYFYLAFVSHKNISIMHFRISWYLVPDPLLLQ